MSTITELKKRFADLANMADKKNIPVFSDFLDLQGQAAWHEFTAGRDMPPVRTFLTGGIICGQAAGDKSDTASSQTGFVRDDFTERKLACFYPDFYEPENIDIPTRIIKVSPLNQKFSDALTHRDFLGAVLNTGIERELTGDILVKGNLAYMVVREKMADYICAELVRVKSTSVRCEIADGADIDYTPNFLEEIKNISSERADCILGAAFSLSRSEAEKLISAGKLFVSGREITSKSYEIPEGSIVSLRGYGRFIYDGAVSTTRKGRLQIKIRKYV